MFCFFFVRVKRGVDTSTGETVALKVIDKTAPYEPSSEKKLKRLQSEVSRSTDASIFLRQNTLFWLRYGF